MTWSIVARDDATGALGIAVASKAFAVGAICPHLQPGAGAVCTQSLTNPYIGIHGVSLIGSGLSAPDAIKALLAADEGRALRQVHGVDAQGRNVAHTGDACVDWAGHRVSENVSVAGNMLAGPQVVDATLKGFQDSAGRPLAERLLRAMDSGDLVGGDKRGRQSAAIKVVGTEDYGIIDLRADDHDDPIGELWRLYQVAHERHLPRLPFMSRRDDFAGLCDFDGLDAAIGKALKHQPVPDFTAFWDRAPRGRNV